ncbi:hypothetical protein [Mycobacterium kiyosense]
MVVAGLIAWSATRSSRNCWLEAVLARLDSPQLADVLTGSHR